MRNEIAIRIGFFLGIFALVAIWELLAPRRALTTSKTWRWGRDGLESSGERLGLAEQL
jgi:hypothetical protein